MRRAICWAALSALFLFLLTVPAAQAALSLTLTDQADLPIGVRTEAELLIRSNDLVSVTVVGEVTPWDGNNWLGWTRPGQRDLFTIVPARGGAGETFDATPDSVFGLSLLNDITLGAGVTDSLYSSPNDAFLFSERLLSLPPEHNPQTDWFIVYDVRGLGFQNYRWRDADGDANDFSGEFDLLIFVDDDHTWPNYDYDDFMAGVRGARPAEACDIDLRYAARSIAGDLAPPPYGLRLDGFFDGASHHEVTFRFDRVSFDESADGTARLAGEISVAEYDNSGTPGDWASTWNLDVHFDRIPGAIAAGTIPSYDPEYRYFRLVSGSQPELVNRDDPDDYADLFMYPDSTKPFQVGVGANGKNANFGASGWLTYVHYQGGTVIGDSTVHVAASDFLMDLVLPLDCPGDTTLTAAWGDTVCLPGFTCTWPICEVSAGVLRGDTLCFVSEGPGTYEFLLIGRDSCGQADTCRTIVTIEGGGIPTVSLGDADTLYARFCLTDTLCIPYSVSDPDGPEGLVVTLASAPDGTRLDTLNRLVCLPLLASGEYTVTLVVTDDTGNQGDATIIVSALQNGSPFIEAPATPSPFICVAPGDTVCTEGWAIGDPDGDPLVTNTLGSGTFDPETGTICTVVGGAGQYTQTLVVSDSCGLTVKKTLTFEVLANAPPVVTLNAPDPLFLCGPDTYCLEFTAVDPDDEPLNLESNIGEITGNTVCVAIDTEGLYTVVLTASDACGTARADTASVLVQFNRAPSISAPTGAFASICADVQDACLAEPVLIADPDSGDQLTVDLPDGVTLDLATGELCILNAETGTYPIHIEVTDACGLTATADINVRVVVGSQPDITFSSPDTTIYVCDPDTQLCFYVSADDGSGGPVTIEEILNPGFFDAETGLFCFNPDSVCFDNPETLDTTFCLIFSATGECGTTVDTLCVTVVTNRPPLMQLPGDRTWSTCDLSEICLGPVAVTDPDGDELVVEGIGAMYVDGTLCFTPEAPGDYYVGLSVTDTCGHMVRDSFLVQVELNLPPLFNLPDTIQVAACGLGQVCLPPLGGLDPEGGPILFFLVEGPGEIDWETGIICVAPEVLTSFQVVVAATDGCDSTLDTAQVVIVVNQPPVFVHVPDTTVHLCAPGDSICVFAIAEDPDGDSLIGSLPKACFIPDTAGTYLFPVSVADSCNAPVEDTMRVHVAFNHLPELAFSYPDTTLHVCDPDTIICFDVSAVDPDGDNITLREILNPGTFDAETGRVCFNPADICFGEPTTVDTTICLIFGATDACGVEVVDSLCLTIVRDQAPIVELPADTTLRLCGPGQVCLDGVLTGDPDGDPVFVTTSEFASYEDGILCFYADTAGSYTVIACGTDPCELSVCDTIVVDIAFDTTPVVILPADFKQVLCAAGTFCFAPLEISDADGDPLQIEVSGGTWNGSEVCVNAQGAGVRTVIVTAIDECGLKASDTVKITVALNTAPNVLIKNPKPLTLCDIDTVLCYPVKVTDLDDAGTATLRLIKTDPTVWSLQGNQLCLDASVVLAGRQSGSFQAIVEAEDPCGAKGRDTIVVTLKVNRPPVAVLPADSQFVLCMPGQVCVTPLALDDPDGDSIVKSVAGGEFVGDNICAFVDRDTVLWITLRATDPCGRSAVDSMRLDITINEPPLVLLPDVGPLTLCAFDSVCVEELFGLDPDLGTILLTQIAGGGQFDPETGRLCFTPEQGGLYTFTFVAADACAADTAVLSIDVSANQPPTFGESPSVSRFACLPGDTICLAFNATDGEGDIVTYALASGPGSVDPASGLLCFAPEAAGSFTFVVSAVDSCGALVLDTGYAEVSFNRPPELQFHPGDTTIFVCSTDTELCFRVTATDADGETPVIREILNPGTFDPQTGIFCFNPADICFGEVCSEDTTICLVFAATDACGAEVVDSMCVRILANRAPAVTLGSDTALFICAPTPFCLPLAGRVSDPDLDFLDITVAAPGYNLENQSACIDLDTTGRYALIVCAADPCGLSRCDTLYIDVVANTAPVVQLPSDSTVVACSVDSVCIPFTALDADPGDQLSIFVSGGAVLRDDGFCFVPDQGDGVYTFVVSATDLCGLEAADTVAITVDVNDPPQLSFSSPDTAITVCNADTELCFVVTASDPDGEAPTIEEVLVPGFFNPENGAFCFNPDSICFSSEQTMDTTICVVFKATDLCGAVTYDSLCITVVRNKPPVVHFSVSDTTLFLCTPDTLLCFDVWGSDPEGDAVVISEVRNPGAYFPETGQFCFNPDSICFSGASYDTTFCVIFAATDACGNVTVDSLCLGLFANHPPVVQAPDTVDVVICAFGEEVCISPVTATDVEEGFLPVTAPGATYDDLLNSLCFVADSSGTYVLMATATDNCGAVATYQITVRVALNQAPQLSTPGDTSVFVCGPGPVCFDWSYSDPEGDSLGLVLTTDGGTAYVDTSSGQLCLMISEGGQATTVNVVTTDACGATASSTFTVSPTLNSPPRVTLPDDFTVKACAEGEYCFGPVQFQDPDGNFDDQQIAVQGGRFDFGTGQVCADITGDGSYTVIVSATDSCGATGSDTVTLTVTVNQPPVTSFSFPDTTLFLCQPDTVLCFVFSAVDADGDLITLNEILNPGTFDAGTGEFCFNPSEVCFNNPEEYDTTICVIFAADDECGATTYDTLCLQLTANAPPIVTAPADTTFGVCASGTVCLAPFSIADPNGSKDALEIVVTGPPHQFDTATGVICFDAEAGTYTFVVTATDRCGAAATDSVTVTVTPNSPPLLSLPADFPALVCADGEVCFPVEFGDPDVGDSVVITVDKGGFDPQTGEICFTPGTGGVQTLVATATDLCGAQAVDTVRITVSFNSPPAWTSVPAIDSFFCAAPGAFCFAVAASDPDGQPVRYTLLSGPGSIDSVSGQVCFAPGASTQSYNFVVSARDACGASTLDTAAVTIRVNEAPVLVPPRDTSASQCAPTQFCFAPLGVSDPDDDPVTLQILSGPGTLNGNQLCFSPDTPGLAIYCFTVRATDPCGKADTTNFCAQVTLNRAPVITAPADFTEFLCDSAQVCFSGVSAQDLDGDPVTLTKTAGPGTFDAGAGQVCFAPAKSGGTYTFIFRATDPCASQDVDTVVVTVRVNNKPTLFVPASITNCLDSTICIPISVSDPDAPQIVSVTQLSGPAGTFTPSPLSGSAPLNGQWCWNPTGTGNFMVVFEATDACGAKAVDTTNVRVETFCDTLCFESRIALACPDSSNPNQWMFQGRTATFPVTTTIARPIGAFDFLIAFDASALSLLTVSPGADISAWEFFTFRLVDPNATCTGICPSGLVRIVGIADINNGKPLSDSSQVRPGSDPREFARIQFLVSNNRTLAGQFIPVKFWWNDCGDNTFSSPDGDLYVASTVDPDTCSSGGKTIITSCATFHDGGGCIPRATDIDERGDLNLNGIAYEIADAVLYSNYFISGPSVLDVDPIRRESQIAASDINGDGAPLTVADLVFLIRIILGLEDPIDDSGIGGLKVPAGETAEVTWSRDSGQETSISVRSASAVGAAAFELNVQGTVEAVLPSAAVRSSGLTLAWEQRESTLRILVYSLKGEILPALDGLVATVKGTADVRDLAADLADDRGLALSTAVHKSTLRPDAFHLAQNYPNPFNPETEIRFTLSRQAEVRLSVFNLLGRTVGTLVDGQTLTAGEYTYRWLARDESGRDLPSGVYMYRLEADGVSETRKMLLLR